MVTLRDYGVTVNVLNTVWKASKKHIKRKGVDFFLNWCYNIGTIEKTSLTICAGFFPACNAFPAIKLPMKLTAQNSPVIIAPSARLNPPSDCNINGIN